MDRARLKFEPATFTPLQREAWEAESPRGQLDYLTDPVTAVFCGLRTNSKGCSHTDHCKMLMRDMQRRDMEAGLPDIRYNFCIGGDGEVYEGRGWASRPSLPSRYSKWVSHSLYIAFVGPLTAGESPPPLNMLDAFRGIVKTGIDRGPVSFIQKLGRGDLEYVPREGWGGLDGQNYVKESIQLTPISHVRIVSTGEREDRCSNVSECAQVLRRIQKYHMKFCGLEDIAYK
ncbi:peptidoglycan recognition protein 4-like [Macrosteles quadrilineatus]|uniref:peptidoglycan recognition protein 4-like n=1 Tax=Macrosteles quadrilineatus TaxID=74068 RepID=UPI0023E0D909|nr:peptidoglycan recognition protein 4-like [Macrosteles quadrilineatus]